MDEKKVLHKEQRNAVAEKEKKKMPNIFLY